MLTTAWMFAGIGAFLTYSVELSSTYSLGQNVAAAAQSLVAILFGLIILAMSGSKKISTANLVKGGVVLFVLGVALYFAYLYLEANWTCPYARDRRLIVGETFTPALTEFLEQQKRAFSCDLVLDFAGDTTQMFAFSELLFRFLMLGFVYVLTWFVLATLIICIGVGLSNGSKQPNAPETEKAGT
ncbi:hypothetical protein [Mesorhizobium helmanticense]|nr:hypothetical protein [Mesorhizobium helmanticense]